MRSTANRHLPFLRSGWAMKDSGRLFWLFVGIVFGSVGVALVFMRSNSVQAGTTDRFEDFIM